MSKKKQIWYQQGDVMLIPVDSIPEDAAALKHKVLQEGETTGHMHRFDSSAAVDLYVVPAGKQKTANEVNITFDGNKYIKVSEISLLSHEEHKPISVPPGMYRVDIVKEFDYDTWETTLVRD